MSNDGGHRSMVMALVLVWQRNCNSKALDQKVWTNTNKVDRLSAS